MTNTEWLDEAALQRARLHSTDPQEQGENLPKTPELRRQDEGATVHQELS